MPVYISTNKVDNEETYDDLNTIASQANVHWDNMRFSAGNFVADTAASISYKAGMAVIEFPDVVLTDNMAAVTFEKPDTWTNGVVTPRITYTAAAAGSLYRVQALFYVTAENSQINTGSTSGWEQLGAVGGTYHLEKHSFAVEADVDADDWQISFRLRRDGTHAEDTDTSDLFVPSVTIEYVPNRQFA